MLAAYREEYEATPGLTIDELLAKYDITTKDIKGYTKWEKRTAPLIKPIKPVIAPKPLPATNQPPLEKKTPQESIDEFKELALDHALNFMKNDARFSEVKEFKDIVAIVDSLEKSYNKTTDSGPTINILVQNLMERFKDDV